jgi:arylsulfatase A-like enzyme
MDTHIPFRPAEEYDVWTSDDTRAARKRVNEDDVDEGEEWKHALRENLYDGTIRQADAVVKKIIDDLRSDGQFDNTLVVVTADHGEGFGECDPVTGNAYTGHDDNTPETLLHVPLISKAPGQSTTEVVEDPVGLVDFPRVVRAAVAENNPSFDRGRNVLAGGLMDGDIVDVAYERHESTGVSKYIRTGNDVWTVHAPTPRVEYLMGEDAPTDIVEEMASLSDAEVIHDADTSVSEATQKQLNALGYTE